MAGFLPENSNKGRKRMEAAVSVIIPIYNCKKYMRKCIDSVMGQSYSNVHVILVDDGSTDGSAEICDEYAQQSSRVRVIHQKNTGPGSARNTGLDAVNGIYFMFVDADDYIAKDCVRECVRLAEEQSADMVQFNCVTMLDSKDGLECNDGHLTCMEDTSEVIRDYFLPGKDRKLRYTIWGWLYRYVQVGEVRFSRKSIGEDAEYAMRTLSMARRIVRYHKCMYCYRAYNESITRTLFNHRFFDTIEIAYRDMLFAEASGCDDLNWDDIIQAYFRCCETLIGQMAQLDHPIQYEQQLQTVVEYTEKVRQMAQNHGVHVESGNGDSVADLLKRIEVRKCKRNSFSFIVQRGKRTIHTVLAKIKMVVRYEYKLD